MGINPSKDPGLELLCAALTVGTPYMVEPCQVHLANYQISKVLSPFHKQPEVRGEVSVWFPPYLTCAHLAPPVHLAYETIKYLSPCSEFLRAS